MWFVRLALLASLGQAPAATAGDIQPVPIVQPPRRAALTKAAAPQAAALDSLTVVGTLPDAAYDAVAFGDSDHDGATEIFLGSVSGFTHGDIYEYSATGSTWVMVGMVWGAYPFALGDVDQDGKSDLVAEVDDVLQVFESPDSTSFPSVLVWQSPPLSSVVGYPTIADTDRDGQMEILTTKNGGISRLVIYECTGDNTYVQRFLAPPEHQYGGRKLIGDFNQNGLVDIATSGSDGYVRILEAQANDVWTTIYADSTGMYNAYPISGGVDTDGDTKPELFVSADDGEVLERHTLIYQAVGQTFQRIATLTVEDGATGEANGVAVLEPDQQGRFLWAQVAPCRLQFYGSPKVGTWTLESETFDTSGSRFRIHVHDMNRNARDEVYWMTCCASRPSWILERPTAATDTRDLSLGRLPLLTVYPNPIAAVGQLRLRPDVAAAARCWSVYDVAGRRLINGSIVGQRTPAIDFRTFTPGLYFVRIEDETNRVLSTGRAVVIRNRP